MAALYRGFYKKTGKIGTEKAGNFAPNNSEVFPG